MDLYRSIVWYTMYLRYKLNVQPMVWDYKINLKKKYIMNTCAVVPLIFKTVIFLSIKYRRRTAIYISGYKLLNYSWLTRRK